MGGSGRLDCIMRINLGAIASGIRNRFLDTFNRTNTSTDLGDSSDGSKWRALRGTLKVTGNKASTSDSASSYPAASISMPKNDVTISLEGTGNGGGSLLWVTDSGNWWATDIYQYTYSTPWYYTQFSGNYNCNAYGNVSGCDVIGNANYNRTCNINGFCCAVCNAWNSNNSKNAANCRTYSRTETWACTSTLTGYNCAGYYTYSVCNSGSAVYSTVQGGTYYYYPTYIRILRSIANTVSEVTSGYLGDNQTIQSLRTIISGNQITVKGYSGANLTTQVGTDLVYTATGAAITPEYGIVITPSGSNTVNTIDSVTIE
jgi:hypothetical protein